jgi:hypothetical protein
MKKTLILIAFFGILIASGWWYQSPKTKGASGGNETEITWSELQIEDKMLKVEVADTPEKKLQGLSGREKLESGFGMVFPYLPPQNVNFWMPEMKFSIDIIYVRENEVVQIFESVPFYEPDIPRNELPVYRSNVPVDLVLEVPAGWSAQNGVKIDSKVSFEK